jgi:hypothetical protein
MISQLLLKVIVFWDVILCNLVDVYTSALEEYTSSIMRQRHKILP